MIHNLTDSQYDTIYNRALGPCHYFRRLTVFDIMKEYIKEQYNGQYHESHNDNGTILFETNKEYNWFLLNV